MSSSPAVPYSKSPQVDMCGMCDAIIDGQYLTALDNKFHPECFVCCNCKQKIQPGQDFFERYGRVLANGYSMVSFFISSLIQRD
jgi:hypothetical protein